MTNNKNKRRSPSPLVEKFGGKSCAPCKNSGVYANASKYAEGGIIGRIIQIGNDDVSPFKESNKDNNRTIQLHPYKTGEYIDNTNLEKEFTIKSDDGKYNFNGQLRLDKKGIFKKHTIIIHGKEGDGKFDTYSGMMRVSIDYPEKLFDALKERIQRKVSKYENKEESVKMKKGGTIKNQYKGKAPEKLWDFWSKDQRKHFLTDHETRINELHKNEGNTNTEINASNWYTHLYYELPSAIKKAIKEHATEGEYAKGGKVKSKKLKKYANGSEIDNKDLLPPVMVYSKNLQLASDKFGITINEARNKYGKYTIGEWEILLNKSGKSEFFKPVVNKKGKYFTFINQAETRTAKDKLLNQSFSNDDFKVGGKFNTNIKFTDADKFEKAVGIIKGEKMADGGKISETKLKKGSGISFKDKIKNLMLPSKADVIITGDIVEKLEGSKGNGRKTTHVTIKGFYFKSLNPIGKKYKVVFYREHYGILYEENFKTRAESYSALNAKAKHYLAEVNKAEKLEPSEIEYKKGGKIKSKKLKKFTK